MAKPPAEIKINLEWCKCCCICIEVCPVRVYTRSDYVGGKGSAIPLVAHPEKCIRCSLCELMCPDMAISVRDDGKSASKKRVRPS